MNKMNTHRRGERKLTVLWTMLWNKINSMETIQVVLDRKLLQEADRAARRTKQNRSALIREALRAHLRNLGVRILEEKDREGYTRQPHVTQEFEAWESEAAWPER